MEQTHEDLKPTLRIIHDMHGNIPIAVSKDAVVWDDKDYLYIDTGVKPEDWVKHAEKAAKMWVKE